jgi:DNA repair exonuclease SbcCD nuclease subunit
MIIAVTADVHLRKGKEERVAALRKLCSSLNDRNITTLVAAGDLLDGKDSSYHDVDALMKDFSHMELVIVPGNHDVHLTSSNFTAPNIRVIEEWKWDTWGRYQVLYLPYYPEETMNRCISWAMEGRDIPSHWILISHGDYGIVTREQAGNEKGYFPLTKNDLAQWNPHKVILGHIHNPQVGRVSYCGSPFPLDRTEEGLRQCLLFDSEKGSVEPLVLSDVPVFITKTLHISRDTDGETLSSFFTSLKKELSMTQPGDVTLTVRAAGFTPHRDDMVREIEHQAKEGGFTRMVVDTELLLAAESSDERAVVYSQCMEELDTLPLSPALVSRKEGVEQQILELLEKAGI